MTEITKFEYDNIKIEINYYCDVYFVKDKDFNSDFIFSDAINRYINCKENANYLINEKVICATIKTICKRSVLNYIYKNNVNYNTVKIDENYVGYDLENQVLIKKLYKKLDIIFSSLSEKEQALFELLSDKDVTKSEACRMLNIDKEFYVNFIEKLKRIVSKFL